MRFEKNAFRIFLTEFLRVKWKSVNSPSICDTCSLKLYIFKTVSWWFRQKNMCFLLLLSSKTYSRTKRIEGGLLRIISLQFLCNHIVRINGKFQLLVWCVLVDFPKIIHFWVRVFCTSLYVLMNFELENSNERPIGIESQGPFSTELKFRSKHEFIWVFCYIPWYYIH